MGCNCKQTKQVKSKTPVRMSSPRKNGLAGSGRVLRREIK